MTFSQIVKWHTWPQALLSVPLLLRRVWLKWRQKPADEVLERIGSLVKDAVVFEAREFDGIFSIKPRSHLLQRILRDGHYEPRISSLYFAYIEPDRDIIDVGANIGFFTIGGAKKLTTGRLLATEPTTAAFHQLSKSVVRNGVSERVILFKGLVGSSTGEAQIRSIPGCEEYSSIGEIEHVSVKLRESFAETVSIERLDNLCSSTI